MSHGSREPSTGKICSSLGVERSVERRVCCYHGWWTASLLSSRRKMEHDPCLNNVTGTMHCDSGTNREDFHPV